MAIPNCILCTKPITDENDSKEHLIPNAIGGRKKITGFICKKCNNDSGHLWDCELAKQLNPLSLFFKIDRENGDVPSQFVETTKGEKLEWNPDGSLGLDKPQFTRSDVQTGIKINVKARSMQEMKNVISGIAKKYPQIDPNELLKNAVLEKYYPKGMLHFPIHFGGRGAGRSLVKTALALISASGINPFECEWARDFLIKDAVEFCFGYYYAADLVKNRPEGRIFHCVAVKGTPETKQVLAYIEYFSAQRVIVCLSKNYVGKAFDKSYSIDPVNGEELDLKIELTLSPEDVEATFNYKRIPDGPVQAAYEKVIPLGLKTAFEQELDDVINEAVEYAFKNSGYTEGGEMTEEVKNRIIELSIEKMRPFLLHLFDHS